MASGGMGDVLAGVIGSLVAKGVTPCHAAKVGVFLHGLAADIAIEQQKTETICASELIAHLQQAISSVRNAGRG
jgi:NAD(P)H-hydrate epimerase